MNSQTILLDSCKLRCRFTLYFFWTQIWRTYFSDWYEHSIVCPLLSDFSSWIYSIIYSLNNENYMIMSHIRTLHWTEADRSYFVYCILNCNHAKIQRHSLKSRNTINVSLWTMTKIQGFWLDLNTLFTEIPASLLTVLLAEAFVSPLYNISDLR